MNFFQLPSSLAFPRAMVAGQQLPQGLRMVTAACALGPLRLPAWLCAGCTRRCRCGAPSAGRAAEREREREGEEGEAAGAEGGERDRAGWAAPSPAPIGGHAAARGLSLVRHALLSPLGFRGSASPQLPLPLPLGTRARAAPASCDLCRDRPGQEKVRGKDGRAGSGPSTQLPATLRRIGGGRTLYLYFIPRRGGTRLRPLAARMANRGRGGAGPRSRGGGHRPAQRSRGGGLARGGAERGGGDAGSAQAAPHS